MNTEIQLPAAELKAALPGLAKVIGKSTSLPVLACVRVGRDAQGRVSLQGTDLDDYATYHFTEPQPGPETALLVPFGPLARAGKGARDPVVLLSEGKETRLRSFVSGSPIDQTLECVAVAEWPVTPAVPQPGFTLGPEFRAALPQALDCASEDATRLILNGACLDVSNPAAHYLVGTNGRILYSANSFNFDLKESLLLPRRRFLFWSGLLEDGAWSLACRPAGEKEDGWVQLKSDHWTFITRQIAGNYPNWRHVVPGGPARTVIHLSEAGLKTLLEVIPRLPGEALVNSPLTLKVTGECLLVEAGRTEDQEPAVVPIAEAQVTGQDNQVTLKRHYLLKALRFGLKEIQLFDANTPVICRDEGRRIVIAAIDEDKKPSTAAPAPSPNNTDNHEIQNERNHMSRINMPETETRAAAESPMKSVVEQIEKIRETLRDVIGDFQEVLATLKLAEKEKKATEKEVESVRATLRSLQKVQL